MLKDIYLTDVYGMATKLKDGALSDAAAVKNFLLFIIIFSYSYEIPVNLNIYPAGNYQEFAVSVIFWAITVSISFFGIRLVFNTNNKGDGVDFFKRFCALSLPVSFVTTVIFVVIMVAIGAILLISKEEVGALSSEVYLPITAVLSVSYLVVFYRIMNKNMAIASGNA